MRYLSRMRKYFVVKNSLNGKIAAQTTKLVIVVEYQIKS